jgi:hypothetical protein
MSGQLRPWDELLPYLKLLEEGSLTRNIANSEAINRALELQWATVSGRSKSISLTDRGREAIQRYLNNVWPSWEEFLHELKHQGLSLNADGVKELQRTKRSLSTSLPARAHHKCVTAALGVNSKTGMNKRINELAGDTIITVDQVLRLRANRGLVLRGQAGDIDCDSLMGIVGEIVLPERAFLDGISLVGVQPQAILTVENLGLFVDLPPIPSEVLVIFVPGYNATLAINFIKLLQDSIPHVHFGDLDPEGLDIAASLDNGINQKTKLFVPSFYEEAIDVFTGFKEWPDAVPFEDQVPFISKLKSQGRWLEQERIVFDHRLSDELFITLTAAFSSNS